MPAPPKVLQRYGGIGAVEVGRELEAQQQRDADGHIRIGREIAVDLHGVAVDRGDDVKA